MIIKKWKTKPIDEVKAKKLQEELNIKYLKLCEMLVQRGIETKEQARDFFNPTLENLHDPFLMKDMANAVERIVTALEKDEKILVYGDYDVDGTTSVALMYSFLAHLTSNLGYYIPDRYSEGYGVSAKGIDYAAENEFSLIISLDCGVTAVDKVAYANEKGIDFIICDHHTPSELLPQAVAVLDPKRKDCAYPFKELSGCGVGFKLCQALASALDLPKENYLNLLDLVAVSIASDIVPIVGENRILAHFGLQKLNANPNVGLKALLAMMDFKDKELTISDIVFSLGPKINAPGRMTHAGSSVEILIAQDEKFAKNMASHLFEVNQDRRETDENITGEAIDAFINTDNFKDRKTIVLSHPTWHKGVIGIVASRLVERFYKPTIIFSENGEVLTGSARSIKGFNIYQGIKSCEHLLHQFGGHDFAAGVSMPKANFEQFVAAFESEADKIITEEMMHPEIEIDVELKLNEISQKFYDVMSRMGPFGPGNMQPVFKTLNLRDAGGTRAVGKDNSHIRFHLKDENGNEMQGICFGLGNFYNIQDIKKHPLNICYTLHENHFNGRVSLDFMVKDILILD